MDGFTISNGYTVAAGNFRLTPPSPCINRGNSQNWMTNGVDLDGAKRLDSWRHQVDIGCYERFNEGTAFFSH